MLQENALTLGNLMGTVIEVDLAGNDNAILEKYLKNRVEINVTSNLILGCFQIKNDNSISYILFKYECLPDFCFNCGSFVLKDLLC